MASASSHDPVKHHILDHQKQAFERLVAVGNACFGIQRHTLPVWPRTNSLIIGSSGSGKTFLARAVAEELGVKSILLTTSEWMLLGAGNKGAVITWPSIVRFLYENRNSRGVIIFLDEIDKIAGESSWESFLRSEIFRLLDLAIPPGLTDDLTEFSNSEIEAAREVLINRALIIAAGAFQAIWDNRMKPSLGFVNQIHTEPAPSLSVLAQYIPRELGNRFRSDLIILPPLIECDYRLMLESTAEKVPSYLRDTFLLLGWDRIAEAVRQQQGCRFLEELMLDTILREREAVKMITSQDKSSCEPKSAILKALKVS